MAASFGAASYVALAWLSKRKALECDFNEVHEANHED
jgi:hypothetical protein